jgi:hypothetical protein
MERGSPPRQDVRFTGDGARVRFLNTTHLENKPGVKVRFRQAPEAIPPGA